MIFSKPISDKEHAILSLLASGQSKYGLEMVEASDQKLKRGTIYVTLDRMEKKGFVTSELEEKNPRVPMPGNARRFYTITAVGQEAKRTYDEWEIQQENAFANA